MELQTGFFASTNSTTKVHIVYTSDKQAICGLRINRIGTFQWCSDGVHMEYVECKICLARYECLTKEGKL